VRLRLPPPPPSSRPTVDTQFESAAALNARPRAIILCFNQLRCIITADELYVFDHRNDTLQALFMILSVRLHALSPAKVDLMHAANKKLPVAARAFEFVVLETS
jgi:hypothetical protein